MSCVLGGNLHIKLHLMVLDSMSNKILGDELSLPLVLTSQARLYVQTWVLGDVRPITSTRCATCESGAILLQTTTIPERHAYYKAVGIGKDKDKNIPTALLS